MIANYSNLSYITVVFPKPKPIHYEPTHWCYDCLEEIPYEKWKKCEEMDIPKALRRCQDCILGLKKNK